MDNREKCSLKSPKETASFLSLLFFGWLVPLFRKGASRDLGIKDLYDPLKSDESERLGDRLEREWKKELTKANQELKPVIDGTKKPKTRPNLLRAITRVFWFPYMAQGVILLIQSAVLRIIQPVLQGWIITYFNPVENLTTRNEVLLYAGLLTIVTLTVVFIYHHTNLRCQQIGMSIRIACCSMIYRKILRLDQTAVSKTAAGQVANLISNDVARFDVVLLYLHYIWIMPIQMSLIGYVMWQSVGVAALVGIGVMILQSLPVQGYLSKISARLRSEIAAKTDERVQLMSDLISGIQVVKMYSWEQPFESIVAKARAVEMKLISLTSYLRGFYQSIMVFSERVTLFSTLVTFVLMGNPPNAETTFVLASLFNVLQLVCAICFPQALILTAETNVSLERLTEFLLLEEVKVEEEKPTISNKLQNYEKTTKDQQIYYGVGIEMFKVAADWVHGRLPPTLYEVSLKVKSRSLCAVVGPVGSGKSSLLHLVLGELPMRAGRLSLSTGKNGQTKITSKDVRISYTSQDPWLFSATIRENILFGQPYDERRYQEVTRVCALHTDFEQLPRGDLSFVGERGASLSGGQRARVNLARAVYRDAELYLLDDPLSAVDARVGRHLFEECITGFLRGKTRILVTHQLQYLREADSVILLNRGTIEHQGTYEEVAKSNFHIFGSEETKEFDTAELTGKHHVGTVECNKSSVVRSKNDHLFEVADYSEEYKDVGDEEAATGQISNNVYWGYFLAGGNIYSLILVATVFIAGQVASSGSDYWVAYWTNQETLRVLAKSKKSSVNEISYRNNTGNDYLEAESTWFDEYGLIRSHRAIYIYMACIITCILLVSLHSVLFTRMCMNASRNIHNLMFVNLLQATMRFFNTNPSGRILNRFSKDVGAMDELLPKVLLEELEIFLVMIGMLTMVVIVNNWMIIPIVVISGIFYVVRIYYLRTARSLKRLEGIAMSPVFSQVSSTLDGLTTIRSRGTSAIGLLKREFDHHQDVHTGAWYLTIAAGNAFGLILDTISSSFIASICFSFILLDDGHTRGAYVGLAISQSMILPLMVQYGVRQSTEVIAQMTNVERILQYTNLPKEGPFVTENPPPRTWPSEGGLVFKNVTMRYADNKPLVLKNLNLNIKPGWKVGIVGRTGAGKSSLISALFSLTGDGLEGEIVLDGIDTKSIGLHELRPRISIIPQEPILFSASLRYNLDPFDQYSDAELWDSLREVELGDAVPSLDFHVAGGGANFSVGQRQLICLARAILRNNRVLVLDEATANVDLGTDALIQTTIRRRFADCTVLTIAHRLNTIMDSDRILVMAGGRIVEFGHPHLLLKNEDGHLFQMLQQTGKAMSEKLAGIAETAYLVSSKFIEKLNNGSVAVYNDQITYLDRVLMMAGGRIVEFDHPHLLLKNQDGHLSQMLKQTGKTVSQKLTKIAESAYLISPENTEELINGIVTVSNDQTTYL